MEELTGWKGVTTFTHKYNISSGYILCLLYIEKLLKNIKKFLRKIVKPLDLHNFR